jgi:hypothetical protein
MAEVKFPTEVVDLPSKGLLYPKGSSLSSGKIEIKYMTAKEEDILTSPNLIKQGIVIDKLLESLIVDKEIKVGDLLTGDKNSILVAARILGYGKDYPVDVDGRKVDIDLSKLKDKKMDESLIKNGENSFDFELPLTKRKIKFKFLTSNDELNITKETDALAKISGGISYSLTTRFKYQILSVDGVSDKASINSFVDNELLSRDSIELRNYIESITPDVDMSWQYTDDDGERRDFLVPVTVQFLWPNAKV